MVAEFLDNPGAAVREVGGGRATFGGGPGGGRAEGAGGEAGQEAGEALAGADDAGVQRHVDGAEGGGVAVEEGEEGGEDGGCARGWGVERGWVHVHDTFYTPVGIEVQDFFQG